MRLDSESISNVDNTTKVKARLGSDGTVLGKSRFVQDSSGGSLFLEGGRSGIEIADNLTKVKHLLPSEAITVSAWITVDKRLRWGGLVGAIQDNGSDESGWLLGYNENSFTFALATKEGHGRLTYLTGKAKYELGRMYHLVAVYDGQTMQLYVNGQLDGESDQQSGKINYPEAASFMVGAYRDADEYYGHRGRIREVSIYSQAAKASWAKHSFSHNAPLAEQPAAPIYEPLAFEIAPYLQFGTKESMTVMWKTNCPATSVVHYGETSECDQQMTLDEESLIHEVQLSGLEPETQYFYRVESKAGDSTISTGDAAPFQTAVHEETPFAFAVISDTQGNPSVSGRLAEFAWGQRPNFLLHPGDLVSTGTNDSHWTEHFFPSMNPLIRSVPFFPVLGNHEQNAANYFNYVSLPKPEYFYTFTFGNMQFFMIDSNRKILPGSEQYTWLNEQLANSKAEWKLVCHHHPPYSSDENDYGNLWKTNKSTRGDLRARKLVPLYEKHSVDLVWNGHIHSYERTWPVKEEKATESNAPIYMITGGGGGGLEAPGPFRPFFQNTVRRGHHYTMVRVNGKSLEIQAYDLEKPIIRFTDD